MYTQQLSHFKSLLLSWLGFWKIFIVDDIKLHFRNMDYVQYQYLMHKKFLKEALCSKWSFNDISSTISLFQNNFIFISIYVADTKDPQNSRVIIFSNFRGSVRWKTFFIFFLFVTLSVHSISPLLGIIKLAFRDIMNALASIGDLVKATEFIGQSSGLLFCSSSFPIEYTFLKSFVSI